MLWNRTFLAYSRRPPAGRPQSEKCRGAWGLAPQIHPHQTAESLILYNIFLTNTRAVMLLAAGVVVLSALRGLVRLTAGRLLLGAMLAGATRLSVGGHLQPRARSVKPQPRQVRLFADPHGLC